MRDKGIAVFNKGTMGAVREKDGGFSIPLAYAAYYIWGTRMLSGDFEYEFALYPFTGKWAAADLHRHAVEYNFPLVGVAAPAADGSLGATFQPVSVAIERRGGLGPVQPQRQDLCAGVRVPGHRRRGDA